MKRMMLCFMLVAAMMIVVGCPSSQANLRRATAKELRVHPDTVTVSNIDAGMTEFRWTAEVDGKIYDCIADASGRMRDTSCVPAKTKSTSVGSQRENTEKATPKSSQQALTSDNALVSYLVVIKKTNIRAEDRAKSKVIATAKVGDKVEKIDASDNWFKVRTAKGKSGWIIKSAVKQSE